MPIHCGRTGKVFAFRRKRAFRLQLRLQPLVGFVKLPQTFEPYFVYGNLKFAPRLVNTDFARHFDMVAFFQRLRQTRRRTLEHRATHLRAAVFE